MGARIKLRDGGLYETVDGERFRVRYNQQTLRFECKACNRSWCADGVPANGGKYHLGNVIAREVPEYRWIPVGQGDGLNGLPDAIYRLRKGHVQMRVTRDEAKRLAPKPPVPAPAPAKELTVAQISALLGYEVKVVA